ncbi:MAG: hypothetical protein CVU46_08360 [Chloroflexi bacterium HGW-Chloroflexi-8]|nr:MAG: hypothetical protein CVU46_08360 [Chloroflexi bacterium HGW-Chloroflexi-8]
MKEIVETSTVLAIKIDLKTTKIFFFDIVDEKYHLIATSEADSTALPPYNDIREGISKAIDRIQQITGKHLVDEESNFILPGQSDGSGVDHLVLTFGFFSQIKVISMGLLESVSLESLTKLLANTQLDHIDQIGMNDPRKLEEIIGIFTNKMPEMVIISGGIDDGASNSVFKQLEMLLFCIKLVPKEKRPYIIFAGNEDLEPKIHETIGDLTNYSMTSKIRFSIKEENLLPAFLKVNKINAELLNQKIGGFAQVASSCQSVPMPLSQSMILMAKFLSLVTDDRSKKILVIDFGNESVTFTSGFNGESTFNFTDFSLHQNFEKYINQINLQKFAQTTYEPLEEEEINNYFWQKTIFPEAIPTTQNHLAIEKALVTDIICNKLADIIQKNPGFPSTFDQVIFSGDIFSNYFSFSESLLSIIDGVLPTGTTTFYMDTHGILPVLGSIAPINRYLPVQILESSTIALLAKVFTITSPVKIGTKLAIITTEFEDGTKSETIIEQGMIYRLPVQPGQFVNISIEPKAKIDSDLNTGSRAISVQSGICGIIVDARGRPFVLPKEPVKRIEVFKKWLFQLLI